jgi:HAD superfamily hydrolase (TIGR01509 family)
MIAALIFDFDGLILDTETPFVQSWQEIYDEFGLHVSPSTWARLIGSSSDPTEAYGLLERHLDQPVDRAAIRTRRLERELELLEREPVMPGVRDLIERAIARGLLLGVASSSERAWVHGHLSKRELLTSFEAIVCAEDVTETKPAPDLYVAALAELGVPAREAIAFEDSAHGVRAAKSAGLFCVVVPNQVTRHLAFPQADLLVDSLSARTLDEYIQAAAESADNQSSASY